MLDYGRLGYMVLDIDDRRGYIRIDNDRLGYMM